LQANPVVWWELASHDAERSVAFFREVFGWTIEYDAKAGFFRIPAPADSGGIGGGIFTLRKARLPFLTLYIQVEDIDRKAAHVAEAGGLVVEPPLDIGGGSRICLFNEPSGVTFAMIQQGEGS
jgi:predicted enzyme related to lactoylglutathione lyase